MGDVERVIGVERRSRNPVNAVQPCCSEFAPITPAEPDGGEFLLENQRGEIRLFKTGISGGESSLKSESYDSGSVGHGVREPSSFPVW